MELLDKYNALRAEIFNYFGYIENWKIIPLDDAREYFWRLDGDGPGFLRFSETEDGLNSCDGQYYENEIYTQRYLDKWVYRGPEYTMVVVDTCTDGNKLLQILSNSNERPSNVV